DDLLRGVTLPAVRHDLTSLPARDRGQQDDPHNDWTYETGSAHNDRTNDSHYAEYAAIATQETGVHFCGRLGTYQYTDMQDTVSNALAFAREQFS
ncbi:hypothetical protein P0D62_13655, partial [Tessaracoccus sp. HF-7]|nr:hypothetical protein [Tessaracoccus caeni]